MDIKVTITVVLPDEQWGFSDLLNGRNLNNETIEEIKELILEDTSDLILPENWKIEKAK
jgi:hypothetical protein